MDSQIVKQRELFQLLDDFFRHATGKSAVGFAKMSEFGDAIRRNPQPLAKTSQEAFAIYGPKISKFYAENPTTLFDAARQIGGVKVVLGGGSRFKRKQLNAVRRLLLYADTVLMPDPILPWIEVDRAEERFRHVNLLEAVFFLLRLKPLVDADLAYPPLIVFPSWERLLIKNDEHTRMAESGFIAETMSYFVEEPFSSIDDVYEFATNNEEEFLNSVEKHQLFVAPGGHVGEPLNEAISRYRSEMQQWRTEDFNKGIGALSNSQFVCNGIFERLEPQFHHLENAQEMRAQPLFSLPVQAHYFRLCASAKENLLEKNEVITPETKATLDAISDQRFAWIGNAPINAIVAMRLKNENELFRSELRKFTQMLSEASLSDINRVSSEVMRGIGSLLNSHKVETLNLKQKYQGKYGGIAASGGLSAVVSAIPFLAPLFGAIAPIKITKDYVETKMEERNERKSLTGSLLGILSMAREEDEDIE